MPRRLRVRAHPVGSGGCTPPYFLFQLRVDGHPPSRAAIVP
ncbi:MAG: hypothetical protein WKG01_29395 [Kofleriaceae bacterium]